MPSGTDDPWEEAYEALRRLARIVYHGTAGRFVLFLGDGKKAIDSLVPADPVASRETKLDRRSPTRHSTDFRSVHWFGTDYAFTATQAAAIKLLWEAWEDGTPDVGQETLLEAAGSSGNRLRDVFKDNPAWQALVVSASRGTFRLTEP